MEETATKRPAETLSVLLPARNAGRTLPLAVESCFAQSLPDFELVLVDHGSADNTFSLMKQFARRDSRVRAMKAPKGCRFEEALNFGWRECQGALVARMDADDFAYQGRLQKQLRFLQAHPELAGCGTRVRIRLRRPDLSVGTPEQGYASYEHWLNGLDGPDAIAAERFIDSPLANPSTMVRRVVLERFDGYRECDWAEDYDFWLRLLGGGERLGKVDEVLLDWYDSAKRSTRTLERYSQQSFLRAKAYYLSRLPAVTESGLSLCGAGPIGKRLGRYLLAAGAEIHAFYEVSERRIGNRISGIEVRDGHDLGRAVGTVLVGAVGLPGARDRIRRLAGEAGFVEGEDFFCAA